MGVQYANLDSGPFLLFVFLVTAIMSVPKRRRNVFLKALFSKKILTALRLYIYTMFHCPVFKAT